MKPIRLCIWAAVCLFPVTGNGIASAADHGAAGIDQELRAALQLAGFTGGVESTLPARLGRPVNPALADLGRLLFFDVHHLDVFDSERNYNANKAGIDKDLTHRLGPIESVLATVDPLLATPIDLHEDEFRHLVKFVENGLLDQRAAPPSLCGIRPASVPSGMPVLTFEGCKK